MNGWFESMGTSDNRSNPRTIPKRGKGLHMRSIRDHELFADAQERLRKLRKPQQEVQCDIQHILELSACTTSTEAAEMLGIAVSVDTRDEAHLKEM